MDYSLIYRVYRDSFEGVLKNTAITHAFSSRVNQEHYYKCPCGGKGHFASISFESASFQESVLHCRENGLKWMIIRESIAEIIKREEVKFIALLENFEKLGYVGKVVDGQEAFRLSTERGVPVDILELSSPEMEIFNQLMEQHRQISRK